MCAKMLQNAASSASVANKTFRKYEQPESEKRQQKSPAFGIKHIVTYTHLYARSNLLSIEILAGEKREKRRKIAKMGADL
jgi:hypothetical protein